MIVEISEWFTSNADPYVSLKAFDSTATEFLDPTVAVKLAKSYDNFVDGLDLITLKHQAETAERLQKDDSYKDLDKLIAYLNKLPAALDQHLRAVKIALTVPVSTASKERFFWY